MWGNLKPILTFGHVLHEAVVYPVRGRVLPPAPAYPRAPVSSAVSILTSAPAAELASGEAPAPSPASEALGQLTEA